MAKPFLWVALDGLGERTRETITMARKLHGVKGDFGFKVNLDAVLLHGIQDIVYQLPDRRIFVDLKMFNGHRTMASALAACERAGVFATNAYALAGGARTRDEGHELKEAIRLFRQGHIASEMEIYAVLMMTHFGAAYAHRMHKRSSPDVIRMLAEEACAARVDGIIAPGAHVPLLKDLKKKIIVPGLRFDWFRDFRHSEEIRPHDLAAFRGCEIEVVCGSPIMKGDNPPQSLERVVDELPDLA